MLVCNNDKDKIRQWPAWPVWSDGPVVTGQLGRMLPRIAAGCLWSASSVTNPTKSQVTIHMTLPESGLLLGSPAPCLEGLPLDSQGGGRLLGQGRSLSNLSIVTCKLSVGARWWLYLRFCAALRSSVEIGAYCREGKRLVVTAWFLPATLADLLGSVSVRDGGFLSDRWCRPVDHLLVGTDRPEEPPVSVGQVSAAIDLDGLFVKGAHLLGRPGVAPLQGAVAALVLDGDGVPPP